MGVRDRLEQRLASDRDAIIELVQNMVRIPSENPPGDTTAIADFVTAYLDARGVDYEVIAPQSTMPNIVATIEGDEPGPHLVLNGHLDVFPAGDPATWSDDPFSGVLRDGKLFGRGVNDMKTGTAASVLTFLYLSEIRNHLHGKLTLTAVSDEETFGPWGARYLVEHHPDVLGDCLLSGEPSTPYTVRYGEKGPCWVELNVTTKGGHGGYPHVSPNAIKITAEIIREVEALSEIKISASQAILASIEDAREVLDKQLGPGSADVLTHVTVNVGVIGGGAKVNMIAADCRTELDFRTPIGVSTDEVLSRMGKIVGGYEGASIEVINRAESNACEPDHELVNIIQNNAELVRGIRPIPALGLGGTDCRLWRYEGIPAYVYGPTPYNMGAPDEYVTLDDLLGTVHVHVLSAFDYLTGDRSSG